jgi:hypothetical protein
MISRTFFNGPVFDGQEPTGTPAAKPWYDGKLDERVLGWAKLRYPGKVDDPAGLVSELHKSYTEAEKFIGAPPSEIVRIPKDAKDEAGWQALRTKMGVPSDPKDYVFDGVPDPIAGVVREIAPKVGLTKDAAVQVAQAVAKHVEGGRAEELALRTAKLAEEKTKLDKNWGSNKEANLVVARAAAQKLGVTADQINALENVVGYATVMEMLRNIGAKIGEDKFVTAPGAGGGTQAMSADMALARKDELKRDKAWVGRYMNGGMQERNEMTALDTIIANAA